MIHPLIVVLVWHVGGLGRVADPVPAPILTDTPDYCRHLASRVNQKHSRDHEVIRLVIEGRTMCEHGEVRGGIVRLRKALLLTERNGDLD